MIENMNRAIDYALINKNIDADRGLAPILLVNDIENDESILAELLENLEICQTFVIAVAFVSQAGLAMIKSTLADLAQRGVKGRLITSTYLNFNSPQVFYDLLKIPNLEVRVNSQEGFHIKAYQFNHEGYKTYIVGSSNLTANALKINQEWNLKISSANQGALAENIDKELENLWGKSLPLNEKWIDEYAKSYQPATTSSVDLSSITPNSMQKKALSGLENLRQLDSRRGLLISATGTGKTYLSAFDVAKVRPEKFLFLVHREQILHDAMNTFKRVLGANNQDYGLYSSTRRDKTSKYIFATVQSLSKGDNLYDFAKEEFDYIVIDEAHRAGADSYLKIVDYFQPKFLLGMTATPERTDDFNIFELFDYNIASEIRLQDALESDLLAPFHYYGVSDYELDGKVIDDLTSLGNLTSKDRIDYLLEKLDYYGFSGQRRRGLIFTSSIEEAEKLSQEFNERNIPSASLCAKDSVAQRKKVVRQLETGGLEYIFTRDIFNEGVDIPSVNQVVFLRNTESSIIFIQQLGRGLRKHESKEYLVVIDFIGNYNNNYLIPQALSGEHTSSKDSLRRDLFESDYLPGLSTINFEEIARKRIYESINSAKLDSMKVLREGYFQLKNRLNKIPSLLDFEYFSDLDSYLLATRLDSYPTLVSKFEGFKEPEDIDKIILRFFGRELLAGKSLGEILLLNILLDHSLTKNEFFKLCQDEGVKIDDEIFSTMIKVLDMTFWVSNYAKTYSVPLVSYDSQKQIISLSQDLEYALKNQRFMANFKDYLEVARLKNTRYDNTSSFTKGAKYDKRDVTRFLNFDHQEVDLAIAGYKIRPDKKKMMIFLTMDRQDDFSYSQMQYKNEFLSKNRVSWFSKSRRTMESPEIKTILDYENNGLEIYIFIKKSNASKETSSYFVGQARPLIDSAKICQIPKKDGTSDRAVEIDFEFINQVDEKLYKYLIS